MESVRVVVFESQKNVNVLHFSKIFLTARVGDSGRQRFSTFLELFPSADFTTALALINLVSLVKQVIVEDATVAAIKMPLKAFGLPFLASGFVKVLVEPLLGLDLEV